MRNLNVLIADDSDTAREALHTISTGLGWSADTVDSGSAALAHATKTKAQAQAPYDVIILDWKMPGMDGLAAARAIRESKTHADEPIIVMVTAYSREDLFKQKDVQHVDMVLEKPVTPSSLYNAVIRAKRIRTGSMPGINLSQQSALRLEGIRLLVVDDSDINREVSQRIFEGEGAIVTLANDGKEAVDWLSKHPTGTDAILMDIQMPVMDGFEATRVIRADKTISQVPILALSAGVFKEMQDAAYASGMNDFISKPFNVDSAVEKILKATGRADGHTATKAPIASTADDLPGLAISAGLTIWQDPVVYKRYLRKFVTDYGNAAESLSGLTAKEAEALIHKLKGVAGNLALTDLAAIVTEINNKQKANPLYVPNSAQLRSALQQAITVIAQYAPETDEPAKAIDKTHGEELAQLLQKIRSAFNTDDPAQIEPLLTELSHYVLPEHVKRIHAAIDDFDFRQGERLVDELVTHLGIKIDR